MAKKYQTGSLIADFNFTTPWEGDKSFYSVSAGKRKVLFFLRYHGCRTTQLKLRELTANCEKFFDRGAQLYVAIQSSAETVRTHLKEEDVDFEILCDPDGTLYRLFDIGYIHIGYFLQGLPDGVPPRPQKFQSKLEKMRAEATALGITHGLYEGCEQQLPAVFVLDKNHKALFVHYAEDIVDFPTIDELLTCL